MQRFFQSSKHAKLSISGTAISAFLHIFYFLNRFETRFPEWSLEFSEKTEVTRSEYRCCKTICVEFLEKCSQRMSKM